MKAQLSTKVKGEKALQMCILHNQSQGIMLEKSAPSWRETDVIFYISIPLIPSLPFPLPLPETSLLLCFCVILRNEGEKKLPTWKTGSAVGKIYTEPRKKEWKCSNQKKCGELKFMGMAWGNRVVCRQPLFVRACGH